MNCKACLSENTEVVYSVDRVPVHSVLLLRTKEDALNIKKGDIALTCCKACGFMFNSKFDETVHSYSEDYNPTQKHSATFNKFHKNLALSLIDRFNLHGKNIIEIGCGEGEFMTALCELGNNTGTAFDPAYHDNYDNPRVKFVKDFYSEKYSDIKADFVCCKMTLEHISNVNEFMTTVRKSVKDQDATIFFQIPNMLHVLDKVAFWDVYYEHCSYFTPGSLARLFRKTGFDVTDVWTEYDDQYLMIAAKPGKGETAPLPIEESPEESLKEVKKFVENFNKAKGTWNSLFTEWKDKRVVIWGSGSKGVAFLTTLNIEKEIEFGVDIDPLKNNTFMAKTGHVIHMPEKLKEFPPDVVIIMNPVYTKEISKDLESMGLHPEILSVEVD